MVVFGDRTSLDEAHALLRRGEVARAAQLCRRLLRKQPNDGRVLHLLGVIEANAGRLAEAKPLLLRSLAARPPDLGMFETCAAILLRSGDIDTAADVCRQGLALDGHHRPLLHMAALAAVRARRPADAVSFYDRLVIRHPDFIGALNERGALLSSLGRHAEAADNFERVRDLAAPRPEAHLNLGTAYAACGRHADALAAYDIALSADSGLTDAWLGRGTALAELGRTDEAAAAFETALERRPDCADAWVGLGTIADRRALHEDALAAFERAVSLAPEHPQAWAGRGRALATAGRHAEALAAFERAVTLAPDLIEARLGLANMLAELQRFAEAEAAFDAVSARHPSCAEAWLGRGNLAWAAAGYEVALSCYDRALSLRPRFVETRLGRANCLSALMRYEEALAAIDAVVALAPDRTDVASDRFRLRMHLCDWHDYDADCARLVAAVRNGDAVLPYALLCAPVSAADQRAGAEQWAARVAPPRAPDEPMPHAAGHPDGKIRLAYLSADFRAHATALLAAGLFEHHDRDRFEITALSIGPDDGSHLRRRIVAAFDRFIDAQAMPDAQIAARARDLGIDILVDLKGFTREGRPGVSARRAAPVQVAYLGHPMTMGAPYVDYVVADRILVPPCDRDAFTEKVVTLPHSYQINDDRRMIAAEAPSRAALGLPDDGVVFCCFNNTFKITPALFDRWMRILHATPRSVLWLMADGTRSADNLRREAAARDIDPARLVFAGRLPYPEHLARHRAADLFLDTLPYNAHTTASDALWTGLPVLTCAGETFAGRVGASLLAAIGLPELITHSLDDYEARAVALATDPPVLAGLTARLAANRLTRPLFDTARTTHALEAAYEAMLARHRAGLPPDHIEIEEPLVRSAPIESPAA